MRECPSCKLCFPDNVSQCPVDNQATFHSISGEPILEGKYQLEKRLGQGGMGVVYQARHNFLKTAHAIKVILPDLVGNDPNLVTRFRQEAIAAAAIRHQNIVNVTDFGVVAGKMPFLVMEFVKGESLHDLLVREKRLTPEFALHILSAICSGLSAAHRQGIVHRDLKPLNVMIQRGAPIEEAVKILDFGLAKIKSGELLGSFIAAQTTGLMGSPYYMSPEQWSDDEPDARADVYSLGVMLYQMLAGDVPFKGSSIPSIMKKHLQDAPPGFTEIGLNLPPQIEKVVRHALEKDPAQRTPSVERLVEEMREAVSRVRINEKLEQSAQPSSSGQANGKEPFLAAPNEPRTALRVLSNPPGSLIFLDGRPLGKTEANGWLVVEGIKRGRHRLRVLSDGFAAFEKEINCDGEACQEIVQLQSLLATNISPVTEVPAKNLKPAPHGQSAPISTDKAGADPLALSELDLSMPLVAENGNGADNLSQTQAQTQPFALKSYPEVKPEPRRETRKEASKESASKIRITLPQEQQQFEQPAKSGINLLAVAAAFIFAFFLVAGGGYAAYRLLFASATTKVQSQANDVEPTVQGQNKTQNQTTVSEKTFKAELVKIPGGSFQMGRNDGQAEAGPAHPVTVSDFWMDKFEVTNEEYAQFVSETNYRAPEHWVKNKPLSEELKSPVILVSLEDAKSFAKWRSQRDGVEYRLPTEAEWEYAARNGNKGNLYPWGEKYDESRAVLEENSPRAVGSRPEGANQWGVQDLIGNVWEWTDTQFEPYPGSSLQLAKKGGVSLRGGSYQDKPTGKYPISSVFRNVFVPTERGKQIGFRLVRSGS